MLRRTLRTIHLVSAVLLVSVSGFPQQVAHSATAMKSIISMAPAPHPHGQFLARLPNDARFENAPANYHVFDAATVGEDASFEALTLKFDGETTLTRIKMSGKDFAIQHGGSCYEGNHYSAGQSCSLLVRFTPQGPGHRLGFLKISNSAELAPATFGLTGNGYSPVLSFIPSSISTVPGTFVSGAGLLKSATNMAIDGGDILYVADIGNANIKQIDSSGAVNPYTPFFATPASIAVDSLGIMYSTNITGSTYYFSYFMPWGSQTAYGTAYAPGSCTPSAPCSLSTVGMSRPANMSIDAYDDLFFEEGTKGAAEMPVSNISGGTGSFNLWYLTDQFTYSTGSPASFTVDASGNLYNSYIYTPAGTCYLLEEPLYNAEYSPTANRVAGGVKCGFSGDGGLARGAEISSAIGQMAFDAAGNLYFADAGNQRVRRIDSSTGIIRTIAGTGVAGYTGDGNWATHATLANPTGLAVDSQGQVYIISGATTTGTAQVIRKTGTSGRQTFSSTTVGKTAAAMKVVVSNTGNSQMALRSTTWTGTNKAEFSVDPTTTDCPLTAGSVLNAGQTCNIGFLFAPKAVGSRSATFNLLSNTIAGQNQIVLSGTSVAAATVKFTAPTANTLLATNATVKLMVGVTSSYSAAPTGTVTFKVDGVQVGKPVTLVSGAASITLKNLAAGSHTFYATYNGDKHTGVAHVSESVSVH